MSKNTAHFNQWETTSARTDKIYIIRVDFLFGNFYLSKSFKVKLKILVEELSFLSNEKELQETFQTNFPNVILV